MTEPAPVIDVEVVDRVGIVTLNRPERLNALNGELIAALHTTVGEVADDPTIKVVVLTGAARVGSVGGFCAGGDVKSGGGPGTELGVPRDALDGDLARHDDHAAMRLHLMPKPTIAMIGGPAIGAGCSLAAACDLRYASHDAVLAAGFAGNALSGDYGGSFFWTRIAGTAVARRLYLLDERFSADEALAMGLVHGVVPADELRPRTLEVAARLAARPAPVLARIKENLNRAEDDVDRRRFLLAAEAQNQVTSGADLASRAKRRR